MDFASDGTYHSSGHFTVDPSRAREKLSAYLLQSQSDALLRLVQAAVQRRASRIKIRIGRRRLVFTAVNCEGISTERLTEVNVETLTSCALNLAVQSFLHFGCKVEYGLAKDGKAIRVSLPNQEVHQTSARKSLHNWTVTVWQPGNLWSTLLSGGRLRAAFHKALERCRLAPLTIKVGGRRVNQPFPLHQVSGFFQGPVFPTGLASSFSLCERFELAQKDDDSGFWGASIRDRLAFAYSHEHRAPSFRPRDIYSKPSLAGTVLLHEVSRQPESSREPLLCRAALRIPFGLSGSGLVLLVHHGVIVDTLERDLGCPGVQAVITTGGLKTEVSGLRVLQDDCLEEKIRELRPLVKRCVRNLPEQIGRLSVLRKDAKVPPTVENHLSRNLPGY